MNIPDGIPKKGLAVSVVIPVMNGEKYLGESVRSLLAQTRPVDEIIVVDDGSVDGTPVVVQEFGEKVRYIYQSNAGVSAARNRGVAASAGDFLGFLDHDDLWQPDKLEKQLAAFEFDPEMDMVFGHAEQFLSPELSREYRAGIKLPPNPLPAYLASAMLVRKSAFLRVGLFAEDVAIGECIEWYGRAVDHGLKARLLPEVVYRRRIHQTNTMICQKNQQICYARILKATLDRRRKKPVTS